MTELQKTSIAEMRADGYSYAKIAATLGISENTIKSYCRRNNLAGNKSVKTNEKTEPHTYCKQCAQRIINQPKRKPKKFCSYKCCAIWWSRHPEKLNRKANYHFTCLHCGIDFTAYGNKSRKFCSHNCYIASRFGKGQANE